MIRITRVELSKRVALILSGDNDDLEIFTTIIDCIAELIKGFDGVQ